jgi:heme oxygenase
MNMLDTQNIASQESRAKRLKDMTHGTHESLDTRIMSAMPFASREQYGLFLRVQHQFHKDIDTLFDNQILGSYLPDLAGRRRLGLIAVDLADLDFSEPAGDGARFFDADVDVPTAFGWLYVAEGSNLGAAFLLKEASKLGLSEEFGARHLAAHPSGRGLHWRGFTDALNALQLSDDEDQRVCDGTTAAFQRVHMLVGQVFD